MYTFKKNKQKLPTLNYRAHAGYVCPIVISLDAMGASTQPIVSYYWSIVFPFTHNGDANHRH